MSSLNQVNLIGRVGRDAETRTFPSGDSVTNLTIATTEKWKDKSSGENKEATEWHRIVFNGRLAEVAAQYAKKGTLIYVMGQLKTRKYQDQSGVEKYVTEIRADRLQLLSSKSSGDGDSTQPQQRAAAPAKPAAQRQANGAPDDDIPF